MKVGPTGQVVIPKVFRKAVGISPGPKMVFELRENETHIKKTKKRTSSQYLRKKISAQKA